MKKKLLAIAFTLCTLMIFSMSAFAAKPAIELMYFTFDMNSVGGVAPTVYYRNNSGKTIKYLDWYMTAYNRVGDPAPDSITGKANAHLRTIGPIPTFQVYRELAGTTYKSGSSDSPFYEYTDSGYWIDSSGDIETVYQDKYGNFFTRPSLFNDDKNVYLTEDEISNALFADYCEFDVEWYNSSIDYLNVNKVVITYMDGSTQTVSSVGSAYRGTPLQSKPFKELLAQYAPVYNYKEYLQYNQDLAAVFGDNQKALFDHFITSGMKEGRRGNFEFDLAAYKANNPDLVAVFCDDNVKYYEHYISSGKAEGRKAK